MAINKVSGETREAIKRKSAYSLPNRPSEAGMKPDEIKKAFWQPVVDASMSALGEVDRLADEVNTELAKRDENFDNAVEKLEKTDEDMKEAAEKEGESLRLAIEERIPRVHHGNARDEVIVEAANGETASVHLDTAPTPDSVARRKTSGALEVGVPAGESDATPKQYVDELAETKVGKEGNQTVSGDFSIGGNLYVAGSTFAKDVESLAVKEVVIVANSDGVPLAELSGYVIRTGKTAAYGILYDPAADCVKIGLGTFDGEKKVFTFDPDEAQALATRGDIGNGNIPVWDAARQIFVDSGVAFGGFEGEEFVYHTDDALSLDSVYPVQNRAIAQKIAEMEWETDRRIHKVNSELKFIQKTWLFGDEETYYNNNTSGKKVVEIDLTTDADGNAAPLRDFLVSVSLDYEGSKVKDCFIQFDIEMNGEVFSYDYEWSQGSGTYYGRKDTPNTFVMRHGGEIIHTWGTEINGKAVPKTIKFILKDTGKYRADAEVWGVTEEYEGATDADRAVETIMAALLETLNTYVKKTNHGKDGKYALVEDGEGSIGAVKLSDTADGDTIAHRKDGGALAVGDAVADEDAVNKRGMEKALSEYTKVSDVARMTANPLHGEAAGSSAVLDNIAPMPNVVTVSVESKNLVPLVYHQNFNGKNPVTIRGIVFTTNEDGSITMNGTHDGTGSVSFFLVSSSTKPFVLKKGTYISGTGLSYVSLSYMRTDGKYEVFGKTLTEETKCQFLYLSMMQDKINGKTFNGETIYPMLMRGTVIEDYTQPVAAGTAVTMTCGEEEIPTAVGETVVLSDVAVGTALSVDGGAAVYAEYNRDINHAFAELQQAIISLGGNV